jgi:Na+-transporting NADH:ubiquinone oxidoreductase subunit C
MKKYISMLLFVLILGIVASGILIGMDILTADRIEANEEIDLRLTVLNVFEIPYDMSSINEIYESEISIETIDGLDFYLAPSGEVGFHIEGSGVWGPIIGFMAIDDEFETIKNVAILQQEETPGLGGVVAEEEYLAQFEEVKVIPRLEINQDASPNKENEVDAITGATRTSKAFEEIINNAINRYRSAWEQSKE